MRKDDTKFIELAHKEALKSTKHYRHGAVLTQGRDFWVKACNKYIGVDRTLTRYGMLFSIHAELECIKHIPYGYNHSLTLYSVREGYKLAKPCNRCMKIIRQTPIRRIVFSIDENNIAEMFI